MELDGIGKTCLVLGGAGAIAFIALSLRQIGTTLIGLQEGSLQ